MTGMKNLTNEEERAIEELQMRVKNALTPSLYEDDTLFYRFLKARDFDVNKAEKMLRKHIKWRKINQVDTILEDFKPSEIFTKFAEPSFIGYDKEGALLAYSPTGNFDIYELFKSVKMNNFLKHFVWFGEKYMALIKERRQKGCEAYQGTLIMDLGKLTLANATAKLSVTLFLRFLQLYQNNYPERMKSLYVINAPGYYSFVYSILKSLMSSAMISKIHIFSYSGWKEKLLEVIDSDVLPEFLGGNRTDPDRNPMCETFITHGGKIPEKYFLRNEERYFQDKMQVKTILIPSSEKKKVEVDVSLEGFLLQWEFLVKGKDIGFGLYFEDIEEGSREVIPVYRYSTPDGTERDSYKCHSAGKYTILFDNSYSWLSAKEVEYCITILEPES